MPWVDGRTALMIAAVLLVAGQAPSAGARKALRLFVHDQGTPNRLFGYQVAANGMLTPLSESPLDLSNTDNGCSGDCQSMGYSARRKLLFTSGGTGVSVTDIFGQTPALVPGSPFGNVRVAGVATVEVKASTYVYASAYATDQVYGFRVLPDRKLEALPGSPFAAGSGPSGMEVAGRVLLVAHEAAGGAPSTVGSYLIGNDGALTPSPGFPAALGPNAFVYNLDPDPQGKYVYAADCAAARIFAFKLDQRTARLTPVTGSPFAANLRAVCGGLAFSSNNRLFAIHDSNAAANIQAVKKLGNGTLKLLGDPQPSSSDNLDTAGIDPSGKLLAYTDSATDTLRVLRIHQGSGQLTPLAQLTESFNSVNTVRFIPR